MREQCLLVLQQEVMAGVELVRLSQPEVRPQQVGHGAVAKPIAMQLPLAARRDQAVRYQYLQHLIPSRTLPARWQTVGPEAVQLQHLPQLPASQQAPHCRGRHSRMPDRRSRTIDASDATAVQRSSGNSAIVRGCPASSSSTSMALRHIAACEELISPKYRTWRCTTRPPATRLV